MEISEEQPEIEDVGERNNKSEASGSKKRESDKSEMPRENARPNMEQCTTSTSVNAVKQVRPPPIHIHKQTVKQTLQIVKDLQINKFEILRVNNEKHSVRTESMEEFMKVKEQLKETKTNFFTFTPKGMKPKSVVLKGLTEDEDLNELKLDIETNSEIKILKVTQLVTRKSIEAKGKLPLYIVQVEPEINMSKLFNIKVLNYQRVFWEPLKKRDDIMQCRKCQRFGHAAANCNLNYRCVKCAVEHGPGECEIKTKMENEQIYCVNCKKNGHPASFKGCTIYQQTLTRLKQKIEEKRRKPREIPILKSTFVSPENGTFADRLRQNNNNNDNSTVQRLTAKVDAMAITIQEQSEQIAQLLTLINQLS